MINCFLSILLASGDDMDHANVRGEASNRSSGVTQEGRVSSDELVRPEIASSNSSEQGEQPADVQSRVQAARLTNQRITEICEDPYYYQQIDTLRSLEKEARHQDDNGKKACRLLALTLKQFVKPDGLGEENRESVESAIDNLNRMAGEENDNMVIPLDSNDYTSAGEKTLIELANDKAPIRGNSLLAQYYRRKGNNNGAEDAFSRYRSTGEALENFCNSLVEAYKDQE